MNLYLPTSLPKKILNIFSRFYLLFLALMICFGVVSYISVNALPYLHYFDFLNRFFISIFVWVPGFILFFLVATKEHIEFFVYENKFEYVKLVSVFIVMCAVSAWFISGNIMYPLVKILPNKSYEEKFTVTSTKKYGASKYKLYGLDTNLEKDGHIFYFHLAKERFDYSKIKVKDEIIIKGRQNIFGVIAETVELINKS